MVCFLLLSSVLQQQINQSWDMISIILLRPHIFLKIFFFFFAAYLKSVFFLFLLSKILKVFFERSLIYFPYSCNFKYSGPITPYIYLLKICCFFSTYTCEIKKVTFNCELLGKRDKGEKRGQNKYCPFRLRAKTPAHGQKIH